MATTVPSVLCGVILPPDFLPDDTTLLYDLCGRAIQEIDNDDPDDEFVADSKFYDRCANLAVAYYNDKHHTDYKLASFPGSKWSLEHSSKRTHCVFTAAQTTAVECESSVKTFCAVLEVEKKHDNDPHNDEMVVSSCCIADGRKTTGCKRCDITLRSPIDPGWYEKEVEDSKRREDDGLAVLSQYAHCLADGVSLSEKAQLRLPSAFEALIYYNRRHHKDYKLVDALPFCFSMGMKCIIHCNFIARLNASGDDASDKLFFAELEQGKKGWVVTACQILRGCKTTAGCHICIGRKGKRIIHPTRGFRLGLYPLVSRRLRRRC